MSQANEPARILIVDDHPLVRDGIAARIALEPDMTVCGEAEAEAEAMRLVAEDQPDLVIVDISLAEGDGIDLTRHIHADHPKVTVLVHSMYEDSVYGERALQAGALGYVDKRASRERLTEAIRCVLSGRVYASPALVDRLLLGRVGRENGPSLGVDRLSDRELQVLRFIGQGLATREIAERMELSKHTVDTYREKLKSKLGIKTGAELGRYAAQWTIENG